MIEVSKDEARRMFNEHAENGLGFLPVNEYMVRFYGKGVKITVISWGEITIDVINKDVVHCSHKDFAKLYWKYARESCL